MEAPYGGGPMGVGAINEIVGFRRPVARGDKGDTKARAGLASM